MQFLDAPVDPAGGEDGNYDLSGDAGYTKARKSIKDSKFYKKHRKLHEALVELIDDFGLVKFVPLNVSSFWGSAGGTLSRLPSRPWRQGTRPMPSRESSTESYLFGTLSRLP